MLARTITAATILGAAAAAQAGPWQSFFFGGVGTTSGPFSITISPTERRLDVSDGYLSGDRFHVDVYDSMSMLAASFDTSAPGTTGDQILTDFDAAMSDSRWSSGSVLLDPGTYTVEITVLDSPYGSGGGAYRTNVPAPAGLGALALGGIVAARRRRAC